MRTFAPVVFATFLPAFAALLIAESAGAEPITVSARMDALDVQLGEIFTLPDAQRSALAEKAFDRLFDSLIENRSQALTAADRQAIILATAKANTSFASTKLTRIALDQFAILAEQGEQPPSAAHLRMILFAGREFSTLLALSKPLGASALPKDFSWATSGEFRHSVLEVSGPPLHLARREVELSGRKVVFVLSLACPFSREFLRATRDMPEMREAVHAGALLMAPVGSLEEAIAIRAWNKESPSQQVSIAYSSAEWRMIGSWSVPSVYIIDQGTVVHHLSGWPEGGRMKALRQMLVAARK